ncbi:phosphodiester glycosidase family protein [Desulfotomaculum copahuensis]|uniref:Phosphodiester glycosidase domain-containing protein n=1 Tax=Desulfotomaculum copahuensis TaxID=1838280 RepID=A0A1B7LD95_9FIRM|nr:phosphodiester glycosidase family protein [Desulfotomaculum copahuensis]OAT81064.1 hypothetical protein A6M21_12115 [Desulfotomaculum copahuensis]
MRILKKFFRVATRFLIINFIFMALTSPFVTIYGPFDNLKRAVVGAIMTSRHRQYITWLLSDQQIASIIGDRSLNVTAKQGELLKFNNTHDDSIQLVNIDGARFHGFMLEVKDPTRVKVATARDLQVKGETTSNIALDNNAVAAINAGGFDDPSGTGTGRLPYGVIIHDGRFLEGGDIKGPVQLVGLTRDGSLVAGNYTVQEMKDMNVSEGVSFGPPLILNGKKLITQGDGGWGPGPRTAIGQKQDGTILLLVVDGRQPGYSLGATVRDAQDILYEQGAYVAANLDGGSSSTMFYNGKLVNKPCDLLGERMVPTAFIVQ